MRPMCLRALRFIAVLLAVLLSQPVSAEPSVSPEAMRRCARLPDAPERLACYDALAHGLLPDVDARSK